MITKTFTELASILAEADGLSADEHSTLVRRIRIFDAKNLLPTLPGEGSKAGRLDLEGAAKAAVFVCLVDHGFDAELLRALRVRMDAKHSFQEIETRFAKAIATVQSKKAVSLTISFLRKRGGEPWLGFTFEGSDLRNERVERALDLHADAHGVSSKVRTTLDLNAVLEPVISAYGAE
ncbi:hypothetical protein QBK99_03355 [Corticibacterium sp. UT-5YL-CI-8]|nr:hypothetical protein [Tianweitania sp. UT-5YL-CI-8]